jgi:D-glycero-D-manno-heptose 1,7-bisphosphate phosphatase
MKVTTSYQGVKVALLDRDGVLNEPYKVKANHPYAPLKSDQVRRYQGVTRFLERLKYHDYRIFVVTNQPELSRDNVSWQEMDRINQIVDRLGLVDSFLVCSHLDDHRCSCRKPAPGWFYHIEKTHDIDRNRSFVVGDTWRDIEFSEKIELKGYLINRNYNKGVCCENRINSFEEVKLG